MELLIGLIVLAVIGIVAVFWLLKNDTDSDPEPDEVRPDAFDTQPSDTLQSSLSQPQQYPEPDSDQEKHRSKSGLLPKLISLLNKNKKDKEPSNPESNPPSTPVSGILGKLKGKGFKIGKFSLGKKEPEGNDVPEATHFASLKNYFGKEDQKQETSEDPIEASDNRKTKKPEAFPTTGTAAITTAPAINRTGAASLSDQEEKSIDKEIELSAEVSDLKEKCSHLESMLKEKTADLETAKSSLENESKNRKDFNKVKDILEKDLKDARDKSRSIQVELSNAQAEGERYKKRITLLEEKVTRLEKDLLVKEDKIDELVKRLQTFASPSTSAVPPVREGPVKSPDHLKQSTGDQISRETPKTAQPTETPENPKEQTPPQEETPLKKDVLSPPEPRAQGLHTPPVEPILKSEPTVHPQLPTEPEEGRIETSIPEDLSYPEDSPSDSEPFLKLQPDVMSGAGTSQNNTPQQTASPSSSEPDKTPKLTPQEDQRIFKIIDPDNLFGSEEKKDKNPKKEKE